MSRRYKTLNNECNEINNGDEESNIKFRRSIYIVKDMKKGEQLKEDSIRRIRPGFGLPPKYYNQVLGKTVNIDVEKGTALDWSIID